ncbi:unnamed protein product [Pleuronectes platessa]|uniref:Uncharacterized protein n=1 Tax=Pleuronectes platessa TaxID=8262 RepID=A0A9N7UBS2_PLEPL|nr:unnamed protein product [Pleuronectes platessa]
MKDDADLIPDELLCPICKDLITDAAVIPCCGNSYCDDCIRTALLDSEKHICFTCKQSDVFPDNLIANHFLREVVNNFKKDPQNTKPVRKQLKQEALPQPRLQMSRPLNSRQQDPLPANVTHPPRAIVPTAAPQTQTANLVHTNASGDDKTNAMMLQSNYEYASINHFKKPYGPPPAPYICYRCGKAGHLIRQCPMPSVQPPAPSPPAPVTDQHSPIYSSGQGKPLSPGELDPEPTVRRSPESNPGIGPRVTSHDPIALTEEDADTGRGPDPGRYEKDHTPSGPGLAPLVASGSAALVDRSHLLGGFHRMN